MYKVVESTSDVKSRFVSFCYRLTLLCLFIFSNNALAANEKAPNDFGSEHYVQMLLGLGAVVALIYGCAWILKRMNGGGFVNAGKMRVLGGLSVGTRERLMLVEVAGTQILLGVAPGRVNALHVFDEPVVSDADTGNEAEFAKKFKAVMAQSVKK
jgi:flagellar protein FliO/FliZ